MEWSSVFEAAGLALALAMGGGGTAPADTLYLPESWPQHFPEAPDGAALAGHTEVPSTQLPPALGAGPYHIVVFTRPSGLDEAFEHYLQALPAQGWEVIEELTRDGTTVGRPTIGFRGHGHAGDIRFEQTLGAVFITIHLYREREERAFLRSRVPLPPEAVARAWNDRRKGA